MSLQALREPRFIRKTQLAPDEYRKNFHQIDREVMAVITSPEADKITSLMSKIYLRMVDAPEMFWERAGVLRVVSEVRNEKVVKAWAILCDLLGVASATASKALRWMHEQGIIGYFSGKNGVGLRIFLNRAVSSIGVRRTQACKKFLAFTPASSDAVAASANEPAFNDSFAVKENLDTDINSGAPKNGADSLRLNKISSEPTPPGVSKPSNIGCTEKPRERSMPNTTATITLEDVVVRLRAELEPAMHVAARQAAAREHERTRIWLENRGLPKAARVAQHEAYNVLRRYGLVTETARNSRAHMDVGRSQFFQTQSHPLATDEVTDLAEACIAMLETKGQPVELTLSEMSLKAGGFLLPEDVVKVRAKANSLLTNGLSGAGN